MQLHQWLMPFQLKQPLIGSFFYETDLALSFEIGLDHEIRRLPKRIYLKRAYKRAAELLDYANITYDYVILSLFCEEEEEVTEYVQHFKSYFNFENQTDFERIERTFEGDDEVSVYARYLFPVTNQNLKKLLKEIVKADHGGMSYLDGSVILLSSQDNVMYHCYDDRGVDIAVVDYEKRRQFFDDCYDLLFDFDMKEMKKRMAIDAP